MRVASGTSIVGGGVTGAVVITVSFISVLSVFVELSPHDAVITAHTAIAIHCLLLISIFFKFRMVTNDLYQVFLSNYYAILGSDQYDILLVSCLE